MSPEKGTIPKGHFIFQPQFFQGTCWEFQGFPVILKVVEVDGSDDFPDFNCFRRFVGDFSPSFSRGKIRVAKPGAGGASFEWTPRSGGVSLRCSCWGSDFFFPGGTGGGGEVFRSEIFEGEGDVMKSTGVGKQGDKKVLDVFF